MAADTHPIPAGRARRVLAYTARAVALAAALYCVIALTGTVLGTAVGILITEWSRP